jgi:electron transfer flavoprotein beta subunit
LAEADASVATLILGRAIERIGELASGNGYDLVLTGQQALDTGANQIGPRLAEYLGLPQVLAVHRVTGLDDAKLRVRRDWKGGPIEVEVGLPVLLSVAAQANQPRYPHGARIMQAYQEWEVITWGLADLGLTEEDIRPLVGLQREAFPAEETTGELIGGSSDEAARELVQALKAGNWVVGTGG